MVHHPNDIQTTWHNCGKHWSQHGPASLWNAWHLIETMPWWIGCTNTCFNSPPSRFTWSFHFPEFILLVVEQLQVDYLQWVHCSLPTYSFSGTLYKRDHSSVLFYGCRIRTKYLFLVSHKQAQSSNLKVKIVFKREKKKTGEKQSFFFSPWCIHQCPLSWKQCSSKTKEKREWQWYCFTTHLVFNWPVFVMTEDHWPW